MVYAPGHQAQGRHDDHLRITTNQLSGNPRTATIHRTRGSPLTPHTVHGHVAALSQLSTPLTTDPTQAPSTPQAETCLRLCVEPL